MGHMIICACVLFFCVVPAVPGTPEGTPESVPEDSKAPSRQKRAVPQYAIIRLLMMPDLDYYITELLYIGKNNPLQAAYLTRKSLTEKFHLLVKAVNMQFRELDNVPAFKANNFHIRVQLPDENINFPLNGVIFNQSIIDVQNTNWHQVRQFVRDLIPSTKTYNLAILFTDHDVTHHTFADVGGLSYGDACGSPPAVAIMQETFGMASARHIAQAVARSSGNVRACLIDKTAYINYEEDYMLTDDLGLMKNEYNKHYQCSSLHWSKCRTNAKNLRNIDDECAMLTCPLSGGQCALGHSVLSGTPCGTGSRSNRRCYLGKCVSASLLRAYHGRDPFTYSGHKLYA
ncbi:hypothetical protein CAPTEDRAFT_184936 [Capitella teleta]|uniref:Peptidase M12B domain-containing protein n=1 Tax=Capitella teleta TaxID=283909 RepID=R7U0I5_CAPTE|nr:hypothetical protein CAPTEDRAFT_184936 [Capitella teleta]|eukprot:ELT99718.1 hypothetical protein CAPTEDRAFT_184936 [Capitella teleta]